ncbi:TPA: DnaD domain protein [Candidatus Ventrenecus stercoripullorum]|nr:DnaD domain protein [Candidatus Ventrenecus stercoripullorum]
MPNIEFLTERRFTLSSHLIEVALKNNLSLIEFLLLMYFEDTTDKTFDVKKICEVLNITEQDALKAFNQLLTLNLIEIESSKDKSNKHCEEISLVPIYRTMFENLEQKEQKKKKETIFDMFQKELGRNISPMEYEIINAWLEKGFSEELVEGALKEAVYNGVSSLRYIDKILYEWQKKGYKKMTEVEEGITNRRKEKESSLELFDYNWLEDEG